MAASVVSQLGEAGITHLRKWRFGLKLTSTRCHAAVAKPDLLEYKLFTHGLLLAALSGVQR